MRAANAANLSRLFQEFRRVRWLTRAAVWTLIAAYIPWDYFLLGYPWKIIALHLTPAFISANLIVEGMFVALLRLQKRSSYPNALAVELGGIHDLRQASEVVVETCSQWLGAKAALLAWRDDHHNLLPISSYGLPAGQLPSPSALAADPALRRAASHAEVVIIPAKESPIWAPLFPAGHSISYAPLVALGRVAAVLCLIADNKARDARDGKLLQSLGIVIGLSLDNMRLSHRQYASIMQVLCTALDLRDRATEGHSQRVAHLAGLIACHMGLPPGEVKKIEQAAALHDIGKIGVADAILSKPGPLSEAEWAEMRRHPGLGYEILADIEGLKGAAEIVYAHHERYDGTGYPRGLRGEGIPLAARLFAVVDAYDAMTSERPYRPARSHTEAVAEIKANAGSQFDPKVAQAFLDLERQGLIRPHTTQARNQGDRVGVSWAMRTVP